MNGVGATNIEGGVIPVVKSLHYREVTRLDMAQDQQIQQWLESHRHEKGIHYKRKGKKIYILISGGERPTGGYKVVIDQARLETLDSAYVSAHITGPKPGVMVVQKLTYPYACIQVESEDIKNVQGALMG